MNKERLFTLLRALPRYAAVLLALAIVAGIIFGYYPSAFVDTIPVWAKDLRRRERSAIGAYEVLNRGNAASSTDDRTAQGKKKAREVVLAQSIEQALVRNELERRLTKTVLNETLRDMLARVNPADLEEIAGVLYGGDIASLARDVVFPQAEQDILRGRLLLEDVDFADWLVRARRDARVTIFSRRFMWKDGELQAR